MSELGSLYIKLGEPEGELCGCTCEVGDWAAKHIVELIEQRDKLLIALESARDTIEWMHGCTAPADDEVERAILEANAAVAEGKEEPDTRYDCTRQNAFINE